MLLGLVMGVTTCGVNAAFNYSFQISIDGLFDDNAYLNTEPFSGDADTLLVRVNPKLDLTWISGNHNFQMALQYLGEFYDDTGTTDDQHAVFSESAYDYTFTDWFSFIYEDAFDFGGFGPEYIDRPDFHSDVMLYDTMTGVRFRGWNKLDVEIGGVWGIQLFDTISRDETEITEGIDWEELGFHIATRYQVIPEIAFSADYTNKTRDFDNYESVPEVEIVTGSFGFSAILPAGTDVTLKGRLFRFVFEGIPPRHTESDYNNYGVDIEMNHPMPGGGELSLTGYSKFELSDRAPRLFYRDAGIAARCSWVLGERWGFDVESVYDHLDYKGLEDEFSETLFNASTGVEYRISSWITVGGVYRYFRRDSDLPNADIRSSRMGVTVGIVLP